MRAILKYVGAAMLIAGVVSGWLTATWPLLILLSLFGAAVCAICFGITKIMDDLKEMRRKLDLLAEGGAGARADAVASADSEA